jgi:hypothetical protein
VDKAASPEVAKRAAHAFARSKAFVVDPGELSNSTTALEIASLVRGEGASAGTVSTAVKVRSGKTAAQLVADTRFAADAVRVADTLVAVKTLSDSAGADAPTLLRIAQGYHAIAMAASGHDVPGLPIYCFSWMISALKLRLQWYGF